MEKMAKCGNESNQYTLKGLPNMKVCSNVKLSSGSTTKSHFSSSSHVNLDLNEIFLFFTLPITGRCV